MNTLDTGRNDDPVCAAIDAAEEVRDPLEGLVERTGSDPGAAFAPDVLERLAVLKREDRAAFEALRAQLKKAGCRVTALDEAIAEESGEAGGGGNRAGRHDHPSVAGMAPPGRLSVQSATAAADRSAGGG